MMSPTDGGHRFLSDEGGARATDDHSTPGTTGTPGTGQTHARLALGLAMLVALTPLAIDTYLPAIPAMADSLGVDVARVQTSVSSYLLGFAAGQVLGGPMSDRWGRITAGSLGLCLFIAATTAILFTSDVDTLIVLRFVQALGGGFATVICGAMVRDLYSGREAGRIMSMIATMMLLAPMVAPLLGSALLFIGDWHAIFGFLLLYAVLMLVLVRRRLPETVPLALRRDRQNAPKRHAFRAYGQVVRQRRAMGFLLGQASMVGGMFVYVTTAPFVFMEYFGVSAGRFPFFFGACVLGMVLMVQVNMRLLRHFEPRHLLLAGLSMQVVTSGLLLGLVLLSGDSLGVGAWMVLLIPTIGSLGLITPNAAACYLEFFPRIAGTANALYGASVFIAGGLLGGFVNTLLTGTLTPIVVAIFISGILALGLAMFVGKIRQPMPVTETG